MQMLRESFVVSVLQLFPALPSFGYGKDVLHALRPQHELRKDIGEVADELVKALKKTSVLKKWGWMCIA
jgi:hypothetical protein